MEQQKIFENHENEEGLISKISEWFIQFNNNNKKSKNWAEGLNRHFSKKDREMKDEKMLNITNY